MLEWVFVDRQNCESSRTDIDDFGWSKKMTERIDVIAVWPEMLGHCCTGGGGASGAVITTLWWCSIKTAGAT